MTDGTFRLSPLQIGLLVFTLSLCTTPLEFPGPVDRQLGRDGWLVALPAIAVGLWGVRAAWEVVRRFQGQPFDRIVVQLLGSVPGVTYLVALMLLFIGGAAVNLSAFSLASTATELTRLPPAYPAVLTAGVGILAAYYGPEVLARSAEAIFPLIGLGVVAIFVPLALEARPGRLLPIGGLAWSQVSSGEALAMAGTIRGFLPLLVIGPWCRPTLRVLPLCAAAAAGGVLVAASIALPVTLFGVSFTAQLRHPFLAATGTLTSVWLSIHNLRILAMLVWHAIALIVFAAYLWLGAWLLARLWRQLPWPVVVIGLGALECAAAALPVPGDLRHSFILLWNESVILLGVLVPTLLWILARWYAPQPVTGRRQPAPSSGQLAPSGGQLAPSGGQPAPSGGQPAPSGGQPAPSGGQPVPSGGMRRRMRL